MRPIAVQADQLVRALDASLSAIRDQLVQKTIASLAHLEEALDGLLVEYRTLIEEIRPADRTKPVDGVYEPYLRSMVAFSTIVGLVSENISAASGLKWGRHVFSDGDFQLVGFDKLPSALPQSAILRILPDQSSDLRSAVTEILDVPTPLGVRRKARIAATLEEICDVLGCPTALGVSLNMTLEDSAWVERELGINRAEVDRMATAREIISVPTWSGELAFPTYQIQKRRIVATVAHVCKNAAESFKGWQLAIWMAGNVHSPIGYFEQALGEIGLWKPLWRGKPTGRWRNIASGGLKQILGPLYRVSRTENSPFYFSAADTSRPAEGGRFDLDEGIGMGSLYAAETAAGAWSETLDRQPVVTLRELLTRTLWEITPQGPPTVEDLTGQSVALAATTRRPDTQAVAMKFFGDGASGLRVGLRSNQSQIGIVLFGSMGPNLPATAGIGLWSAEPDHGIANGDLWKYIEMREANKDFPIVLRRFPTEMTLSRSA